MGWETGALSIFLHHLFITCIGFYGNQVHTCCNNGYFDDSFQINEGQFTGYHYTKTFHSSH